ncbi:MAG: glutamate synthase subunit beta [Leptospiraceae bacterium]|nr:glutamate synthase subunit beta [Leptospiraceae bacterium]MDW7976877.1 glutamate synthase subunit beta [Leptospiraceae bacterium]
MGKITGFLEYKRSDIPREPVEKRVTHFKEFEKSYDDTTARIQAARCMDCGIPFCQGDTGCPVDNLIPEWNELVYHGQWKEALDRLHQTNNFPEFTGMLCPAPCEYACTLGLIDNPVSIKNIERTIIERGFEEGWVEPLPPDFLTGKKVAIVGSGPAGLAAAQQLARKGHSVTVFEREDRIGGLLRYGIPDFKMEKWRIDRRLEQLKMEGVKFKTKVNVGVDISIQQLQKEFDAIILAIGAEEPRKVNIPGSDLKGIYYAMDYLVQANRIVAGDNVENPIDAKGKHVVVIGGGDTASDCIGTANRQGAKSVTQLDYNPIPPLKRSPQEPWPLYPRILRTSTSQEEGVIRKWAAHAKGFKGDSNGNVIAVYGNEVMKKSRIEIYDIPNTEFEIPADLVFIAIGFSGPKKSPLIEQLKEIGVEFDPFGNIKASFGIGGNHFKTTVPGIFACGDARRGQSLIVWAISEGRKCADVVDEYLQE